MNRAETMNVDAAVQRDRPGTVGLGTSRTAQIVTAAIALKVAFLFVLAWNSRFVMDEFVQFGLAKYLGNGLFQTIWPGKSVGYAVFYKLAHILGWDAPFTLLIGRMQTALLACATIVIIYACARALGATRLRGLLVVLVLLSFSNFSERIFRTIAEPLAVFFAAAALLTILRGGVGQRALLVAGAFSGLAFLTTQKSIYFNFALGLALVVDALLQRRLREGVRRGALLVLGWCVPILAYCLLFGAGGQYPKIVEHLFVGPAAVMSPEVAAGYGGLRQFVLQTLLRNSLLYLFCFGGMLLALLRLTRLEQRKRIALLFTLVVTVLVFTHDQPWPYVFIMALPFVALWAPAPLDALADRKRYFLMAHLVLALAVALSLVRNVAYLQIDNRAQLALVARAEKLTRPGEIYFDGVGMLPNRPEPSLLWLDRISLQRTLREGRQSEAYRIVAEQRPGVILWSYRLDAIEPLIRPILQQSYVDPAPNVRMLGRRLRLNEAIIFDVPRRGRYALYSDTGQPLTGRVIVDGVPAAGAVELRPGKRTVVLADGPRTALLLPEGDYAGLLEPGPDEDKLFEGVYD